jgi:hypothetical protein
LAFLAVYTTLGGAFNWNSFASANFNRWQFIQDHFSALTRPGLGLTVGICAGLLLTLAVAMVRAPFFRAVAGVGYPLAPRSWGEVVRLWLFYLVTDVLLFVVPAAFRSGSAAYAVAAWVAFALGFLVIFGDYVAVFESAWPLTAIRRSLHLVRRGWPMVILVFLTSALLWYLVYGLYNRPYSADSQIFFLLPLSQLLLEAIITTLVDVVLIFTYDSLRTH